MVIRVPDKIFILFRIESDSSSGLPVVASLCEARRRGVCSKSTERHTETRLQRERRSRLKCELTQERTRRWNRRRVLDFGDGEIANCVLEGNKRRHQPDHTCDADNIDLWRGRLYVGFFFRGFSCSDDMTKRTGVGSIKCLSDCLTQRRALRILDKHACPGERLESDPMQPDRAAKRADYRNATDLSKHDCEARPRQFGVNHSFFSAFAANEPLPSSR